MRENTPSIDVFTGDVDAPMSVVPSIHPLTGTYVFGAPIRSFQARIMRFPVCVREAWVVTFRRQFDAGIEVPPALKKSLNRLQVALDTAEDVGAAFEEASKALATLEADATATYFP